MDVALQADSPSIDTHTPQERREGFDRPPGHRLRSALMSSRMAEGPLPDPEARLLRVSAHRHLEGNDHA